MTDHFNLLEILYFYFGMVDVPQRLLKTLLKFPGEFSDSQPHNYFATAS